MFLGIIFSKERKEGVFDLTTFGSDEAIRIFNKIMQTFFHSKNYKDENGENTPEYGNRLIALISEFLLQIRKDLYSKKTKLKRSEMLEFMITDMGKTKDLINKMNFNNTKTLTISSRYFYINRPFTLIQSIHSLTLSFY